MNTPKQNSNSKRNQELQKTMQLFDRLKKEAKLINELFDLLPISKRLNDPNELQKFNSSMSKEYKARYEKAKIQIEEYLELYAPIKHLQAKRRQLYDQLKKNPNNKRKLDKYYMPALDSSDNQTSGSYEMPKIKNGVCDSKNSKTSSTIPKKQHAVDYKNIHYVVR